MLKGKKILIGITGGIAAYKIISLVRMFVQQHAEVKVIMTPAAKDFVSELTLATLSKNEVLIDLFKENTWANHAILGRWADLFIIAPLTCNTMAKMCNGICDNLLLATYYSITCPVAVAPAMDEDMWKHATTKKNITTLQTQGVHVMPVGKGELASGLIGEGRMIEPEQIYKNAENLLLKTDSLKGKKVLITAGPTHEALDPVRFIANHSSGKMGWALAKAAKQCGAEVTLVLGPVKDSFFTEEEKIKIHSVVSAEEMYQACMKNLQDADIMIMAAAVADYTPAVVAEQKIKKSDDDFTLQLKKTKDILKSIGEKKTDKQILVGFALETNNEKENALKKLTSKNADMIVLNSMQEKGAGFGIDTNKISIFLKNKKEINFEIKSKTDVAKDIMQTIIDNLL